MWLNASEDEVTKSYKNNIDVIWQAFVFICEIKVATFCLEM